MSLEARIELLTSAIIELTAAIGGMQAPGPDSILHEINSAPVVDTPPVKEVPNVQESSTDTTSGEQSAPTGESSSPALTYDADVKPITLALSKAKGPETTKAVLAKFDVTSAKHLVEGQWAAYIKACQEAM